jgi:CzcA family heavy metal efflux pump
MSLVRSAIANGRAVVLLVILACLAGGVALVFLPSGIYPRLHFPRLVAIAHTGTLPPSSMVLSVTRPIEQAMMEVPGIRRVRSKTFRGATEVSALFEDGTDMITAQQQAQSRIAELRSSLPADVDVTVERITPASFPILSFNLTGNLPDADLHDYGIYVIRPALARARGVGRVEVQTSDSREIEVVVDPAKMLAAGLTVSDVAAVLRDTNRLVPVGRIAQTGQQYLELVSGLYAEADAIAATPLPLAHGDVVRVGDVAEVFPGAPDRTQIITGGGHEAAIINVAQQVNANTLNVKAEISAVMHDLAATLPSGLSITKVYDLAEFVTTAIANVRDAILIGGLLAVLVLVLFLRNLRLTLVAAITLPLTVLATFFFMLVLGESINLMSMGGIAVAIGLVIDDAVVVVENIHRRSGRAGHAGIEEAVSELLAPVVGSTLTTVVVLVPLGLLSGVVGQFFRALSLTLSVAVLISLFLALTLIPLLSRWAVRRGRPEPQADERGPIRALYARSIGAAIRRPFVAVAAGLGLAVLGGVLYVVLPSGFLPAMDEGGFVIDYLTPGGTALEETDRVVRKIEAIVAATPETAAFSRRTGAELGMFATEQNKGDILVRLEPRSQRSRSADEIIAAMRAEVRDVAPGTDVEFSQILQDMIGDLEGAPTPIEVKIFGDDPEVLDDLAAKVEPVVAGVRGVVDLVGPRRGNPEIFWDLDEAAVARLGLTLEQVGAQLEDAWLGETATELRLFDRSIPVRVRYPDAYRLDPARLASTPIRGANGATVPLQGLAHPVSSNGPALLTRENIRPMALITARLEDRDLGSAVSEIRSKLREVKLPVGYLLEVGGQYAAQRQAFGELALVLAVAASLVLLILVFQFRAFVPALIILAAAPLSFAGAFLMLAVTGTELNVSSAMGLILLVGLAVKNGIVLLDYAHRLRASGLPLREAVAAAAEVRLRPILMTTLCTLFGLLPLALGIGAGAELQKPLALAVIGGLGISTLGTLFAVPSVYVAIEQRLEGRARRSAGRTGGRSSP